MSIVRHSEIVMDSPVGRLTIACDGHGISSISIGDESDVEGGRDWGPLPTVLRDSVDQLRRYFDGSLRAFDLRLSLQGTAFQRRVWSELCVIPFGETISYAELAVRVGMGPGGSRAVGQANGRNRIAIVVPCHRVIASDGSLGGYAGGIERKHHLLTHEQRVAGRANIASLLFTMC